MCPIADVSAQNVPLSERLGMAAVAYLRRLYASFQRPPTTAERNAVIRARFQAGERQAALAREYGISYQRVFQIVRGEA